MNRWSREGYLAIQGKIVSYEGERDENNWAHGKGTATFEDGTVYEGDWEHGLRQGFGVGTRKTGDVYRGQWWNGMKHGKGQLRESDGSSITGTFEYNKPSGLCVVRRYA